MTKQSMEDRLTHFLKTQHGTAGWEQKLENFMVKEIERARQEVVSEVVDMVEASDGITDETRCADAIDQLKKKYNLE